MGGGGVTIAQETVGLMYKFSKILVIILVNFKMINLKLYFIYISLITLSLGCHSSTKNPEIFKTSIDTIYFGIINYNDTFLAKEKIYNESEFPLKILNIESSCGCTTLLIKDSTVQKLDSTEFVVSYIPSNSFDSGTVFKRLTIRTNAKSAFKNIVLTGEVKK